MLNLYYTIVGSTTDTNTGLGRFLGAVVVFVLAGGLLFWALGG